MLKIVRYTTFSIVSTLVAMGVLAAYAPSTLAISNTTIVALTNIQRSTSGLEPLAWNGSLAQSAALKAQDMCTKDYWSHDSPDGLTPWTFMDRAGYAYISAGENLAKNFSSDEAVVTGWMNSPGHRANILKAGFTETGVASVNCTLQGQSTTLVVAHYGSRQVARQVAAVTTQPAKPQPKPSVSSQPQATARQQPSAAPETPKLEIPSPTIKPKQPSGLTALLIKILTTRSLS